MIALTVTGSAAFAAGLAVRHHAQRLETARQKADLQAWEGDGGAPLPPAAAQPQS